MDEQTEPQDQQTRQIVILITEGADENERQALLSWANNLQTIRETNLPTLEKLQKAILVTQEKKIIWSLIQRLGKEMKRVGWDNHSWAARTAVGFGSVGLLLFGGQGAGIAALGGAIGVPLFLVCGGGGALLGILIDEISKD